MGKTLTECTGKEVGSAVDQLPPVWYSLIRTPGQLAEQGLQAFLEGQESGSLRGQDVPKVTAEKVLLTPILPT